MNIKGRLEHLAHISMKDRQMGRTTTIAKMTKEMGGIMLTHNHDFALYVKRKYGVEARSVEMNLEGFHGPFFFDHHAIEQILMKAKNKIEVTEEALKAERAETERLIEEKYALASLVVTKNEEIEKLQETIKNLQSQGV